MKLRYCVYSGPAFFGMAKTAASFKNIHAVIFGPRGDNYAADLLVMRDRLGFVPKIKSACLGIKELNTGAIGRLSDIVKQILNSFPEDIVVICPTVTSILLKEDTRLLLNRIPEEKNRILLPPVHYFKDQENIAADKTLLFLMEKFYSSASRSRNPSVNLIGISLFGFNYIHNLNAFKQMFKELGIEINLTIPYETNVRDLEKTKAAWVNIAADITHSYLSVEFLKDRYQQPVITHSPYGLKNTRRFIEELAAAVNMDMSSYIEKKEKELLNQWKTFLSHNPIRDKGLCIFGDFTTSLGLTRALKEDLNCNIRLAGTYETNYKNEFEEKIKGLCETVLVNDDSKQVWNAIKKHDPALILGTLNEERMASLTKIPFINISCPTRYITTAIYPSQTFIGYKGFNNLLSGIQKALAE